MQDIMIRIETDDFEAWKAQHSFTLRTDCRTASSTDPVSGYGQPERCVVPHQD